MNRKKPTSRNWNPYLALGLLAVLWVAWFPFSKARFSDNEGTFTSNSQELERGGKLYLDTWDNKPPMLYGQILMVRAILGISPLALRSYVLFLHIINAFLILLLIKRNGFKGSAPWVAAFSYAVFTSSPNFQPYLAEADLLMLPFLLGSFCLVLSDDTWVVAFSGVLWSLAVLTKQSALLLLPLFLFLPKNASLNAAVWFVGGALVAATVTCLPFVFDGRLGTMLSAMFGIGHGMAGGYLKDGWVQFFSQDFTRENILFEVSATALALYSVAILMAVSYLFGLGPNGRFRWFLGLWLGISLFICTLRGYFFTYYFFTLVPPLAIGFALGLEALKKAQARIAGLCLVWLALFLGFNVIKTEMVSLDNIMGKYRNKDYARVEAQQAGDALKGMAMPGDKALVWSYEPQIYSYSGLGYSAIKSIWFYNLGKSQEELEQVEHEFLTHPPRFIVLHSYRENPPPPDWLLPFIQAGYDRLPAAGGYLIFRLKH